MSIHSTCCKCFNEKTPDTNRTCYECRSFINNKISYEDIISIKKWFRKSEIRDWKTDLSGLNEMITLYECIRRHNEDFDRYSSGLQLQRMFNNLKKVWILIKDLNNEQLRVVNIDKRFLIIKNPKELEILDNSNDFYELELFLNNLKSFEIELKFYSLEVEYKNNVTGISKVAGRRCRIIIKELIDNLKAMKAKTLKNGKK
jgi:hypothetical protein